MNRCLQETNIPECMTEGKTKLIQKDPQKWTAPPPKQLETHNVPTDDMENTNGTN